MAANHNRSNLTYRTNGAAAYDVRSYGSAAPEIQHPRLPQERKQPARQVRVKAKLAVSPFGIFGLMAAACMLVLVIFGYVQLYEATTEVSNLSSQLSELNAENQTLRSEYESKIDLSAIEKRATEMGMIQANAGQTVYLNLSGADRAEVLQEEETNGLTSLIEAIKSSVESLVSYLS